MASEIDVEKGDEQFGPGQLDRLPVFGLHRRNLDPPLLAAQNQGAIKGQANKIGEAKRTSGEQRNHQPVTKGSSTVTCGISALRRGHQVDTEIEQFTGSNQPRTLWPGRSVPGSDRRSQSIEPRPVPLLVHHCRRRRQMYEAVEHGLGGVVALEVSDVGADPVGGYLVSR